jgi:phosphoribosyl-dephospho-CoA transferase
MMCDHIPPVHALLNLRLDADIQFVGSAPDWVAGSIMSQPWVVVRREAAIGDYLPIGIRGSSRSERCAARLSKKVVLKVVLPTDLTHSALIGQLSEQSNLPALEAFGAARKIFSAHGLAPHWGPTGSVGFQLASGTRVVHPDSDLDLVLMTANPISRIAAIALYRDLQQLPARTDLLLETPLGGMALVEYVSSTGPWLIRTPHGPRMTQVPWSDGDERRTA